MYITYDVLQAHQDKKQSALATFLTKNSFSFDFWQPKDTKKMASNIHAQLINQSLKCPTKVKVPRGLVAQAPNFMLVCLQGSGLCAQIL